MVEEAILTLLKVTVSGGIEATNEGDARMYVKTETWEVSVHSFSFDFAGVSELLMQHQVLLQKQMPEVSPLISEMEEDLPVGKGAS
jgi:hypothetical protein